MAVLKRKRECRMVHSLDSVFLAWVKPESNVPPILWSIASESELVVLQRKLLNESVLQLGVIVTLKGLSDSVIAG